MRNFAPQSKQFDEREITRDQRDFSGGMISDLHPSNIPQNAVADLENYIAFPDRLETRKGSQLFTATTLPTIATGYSWTKATNIITKTVGTDFTASDVGRYIIHDSGLHERIITYTDATHVVVDSSTAVAASTAGKIRGRICSMAQHPSLGTICIHLGGRLYTAPNTMAAWTRAFCCSTQDLPESLSTLWFYDNFIFIFTASGIFKADLSLSPILYYQINSACPSTLITA
ncbi:MAG: hypothetical protein KJ899_15380, partial [Gammaproteobacteria bacterium]|nr:hypothetical protein [Gammaproteobacteria bacterium]